VYTHKEFQASIHLLYKLVYNYKSEKCAEVKLSEWLLSGVWP